VVKKGYRASLAQSGVDENTKPEGAAPWVGYAFVTFRDPAEASEGLEFFHGMVVNNSNNNSSNNDNSDRNNSNNSNNHDDDDDNNNHIDNSNNTHNDNSHNNHDTNHNDNDNDNGWTIRAHWAEEHHQGAIKAGYKQGPRLRAGYDPTLAQQLFPDSLTGPDLAAAL
ncbi:unnamed protein product, partial [Polarella glacialis]